MTKKDIVRIISEELQFPKHQANLAVQKTFDLIIEALKQEGRIELRNFGVFVVREREARKARNPKTGEDVWVPSKKTVIFKPGKEMGRKIQNHPNSKNDKTSE